MADQGKRVIVAGLDKDYRGSALRTDPVADGACAEDVDRRRWRSACACGSPANNTPAARRERRMLVVVGAQGLYEAAVPPLLRAA